jgi:hypothetical protein
MRFTKALTRARVCEINVLILIRKITLSLITFFIKPIRIAPIITTTTSYESVLRLIIVYNFIIILLAKTAGLIVLYSRLLYLSRPYKVVIKLSAAQLKILTQMPSTLALTGIT